LIRDRTGVGRKPALERGVKFGRPSKMTDEQFKIAERLLRQGKSIRYVADAWRTFHDAVQIFPRVENIKLDRSNATNSAIKKATNKSSIHTGSE
jgi:hypothetical protein